jgi:Arm domain-containing DNA-binding protein
MPQLTDAAVRKYVALPKKRREIRDTGGTALYLIIQPKPKGTKGWAMRFRRPDGRPAKLTIGSVELSGKEPEDKPEFDGALTLRQARQLSAQIDRDRARGVDVVEYYKAPSTVRPPPPRQAPPIPSPPPPANSSLTIGPAGTSARAGGATTRGCLG